MGCPCLRQSKVTQRSIAWLVCISGACRRPAPQLVQATSVVNKMQQIVVWLVGTAGACGRAAEGTLLRDSASCSSCGVAAMSCRSLGACRRPVTQPGTGATLPHTSAGRSSCDVAAMPCRSLQEADDPARNNKPHLRAQLCRTRQLWSSSFTTT